MFARALWGQQRKFTTMWDAAYPSGTCTASNPHCGASFVPSPADQAPYLPPGHPPCGTPGGAEGVTSAPKSNIPWAIKWSRAFCQFLGSEGFWGGHVGPFFHREKFGFSFWDNNPANNNNNAILRAKWTGALRKTPYCQGGVCENGGTCTNTAGLQCDCAPGYTGARCETLLVPPQCDDLPYPCSVNADCVNRTESSGVNCTCHAGLTGDGESCVDPTPCDPNPCNAGSCSAASPGYSCNCPTGYDTPNCEFANNEYENRVIQASPVAYWTLTSATEGMRNLGSAGSAGDETPRWSLICFAELAMCFKLRAYLCPETRNPRCATSQIGVRVPSFSFAGATAAALSYFFLFSVCFRTAMFFNETRALSWFERAGDLDIQTFEAWLRPEGGAGTFREIFSTEFNGTGCALRSQPTRD